MYIEIWWMNKNNLIMASRGVFVKILFRAKCDSHASVWTHLVLYFKAMIKLLTYLSTVSNLHQDVLQAVCFCLLN